MNTFLMELGMTSRAYKTAETAATAERSSLGIPDQSLLSDYAYV